MAIPPEAGRSQRRQHDLGSPVGRGGEGGSGAPFGVDGPRVLLVEGEAAGPPTQVENLCYQEGRRLKPAVPGLHRLKTCATKRAAG